MVKIFLFILLTCLLVGVGLLSVRTQKPGITVTPQEKKEHLTLFPVQCIDTMKISRDKARQFKDQKIAEEIIIRYVEKIASLGATCVAVGTPYDEEFLPFLTTWVTATRKAGLAVWFRGNWSGWEGWFDYKKDLTPEARLEKTVSFITAHPELFRDGDIFSPSVEPENGGPFAPVNSEEKNILLREYLILEQLEVKEAFRTIGKNVKTSPVSLSGGVARTLINKHLLEALDNTVTLDHYVSDPSGMEEYIKLFHEPYQAHIVFGEFGAPIPDLNGTMTEEEQAAFVDALLWELYLERHTVTGVNYWTLTESSTELLNADGTEREVTKVIAKYFKPGKVRVKAEDRYTNALHGVLVTAHDGQAIEMTDKQGKAELILPQGDYTVKLSTATGKSLEVPVKITGGDVYDIKGVFDVRSGN